MNNIEEKVSNATLTDIDKILSNVQVQLNAVTQELIETKERIVNAKSKDVSKQMVEQFYNVLEEPEVVVEKKLPPTYEQMYNQFYDILKDMDQTEKIVEIEKLIEEKVDIKPKTKITEETSERYEIFNSDNLTEDYELGLRLYRGNLKTLFVNQRQNPNDPNSVISVGEFFPNTFWGTVKQRSRWMAGIVFQGWKQYGWKGPFKTKYFLFRDRKVLISAFGSFLSNLVFIYFLAHTLLMKFHVSSIYLYTIAAQNTFLWDSMLLLSIFMVWRLVHRFYFTFKWYGFIYALQSPFRLFADNFINFVSLCRSLIVFWRNRKSNVWDSTVHY